MQSLLHELCALTCPTSTTTCATASHDQQQQQPPSLSTFTSSSSSSFSPLIHLRTVTIVEIDESTMRSPLVHTWPIADVVIALYSSGFPLRNMLRYVSLRSPLLVNNLHLQPLMQDRRVIRRVLARAGVPVARAVVVDRTAGDTVAQTGRYGNTLVVVKKWTDSKKKGSRTVRMEKPFVEKPVDPEDHSKFFLFFFFSLFTLCVCTKSDMLVGLFKVSDTCPLKNAQLPAAPASFCVPVVFLKHIFYYIYIYTHTLITTQLAKTHMT